MENNNMTRSTASPFHSQWLQSTISDLGEKMIAMTAMLEDGYSPAQGADMQEYKGRKELMQMLEEFSKSYGALAMAYDQLRSETSRTLSESFSSSNTAKTTICAICKQKATGILESQKLEEGFNNCRLKSIMEDPDVKYDSTNLNLGQINKLKDEYHGLITAEEPSSMKDKAEIECKDTQAEERSFHFSTNESFAPENEGFQLRQRIESQRIEDPSQNNCKFDSMWSALEFQITKLIEDNMQQLVELARRNDEKREIIKSLELEVEALKHENKSLQFSLRYTNGGREIDQPRISRWRGLSMSRLFRGCST